MSPDYRRLAAQLVLTPFTGTEAPDWLFAEIAEGLGGVILFRRNVESDEQLRSLTRSLVEANPSLIVAADEEGGEVTRVDDPYAGGRYPTAAALGRVDDRFLTYQSGVAYGDRLRHLGINLALAPVADLGSDAGTLGLRTYGASPTQVSRHVTSTVMGLQSQGVAACAKHFPGLGGTTTDTHVGRATLKGDLRWHRNNTFLPFQAAIDAGVAAVMVGHQVLPDLSDQPASMSALVIDLLRHDLEFKGLIVSDALDMGALEGMTISQRAIASIRAGVDCVILGAHADARLVSSVIDDIAGALSASDISMRHAVESGLRPSFLGSRLNKVSTPTPQPDAELGVARSVASAALQVFGDLAISIPLRVFDQTIDIVAVGVKEATVTPGLLLASLLDAKVDARDATLVEDGVEPTHHGTTVLVSASDEHDSSTCPGCLNLDEPNLVHVAVGNPWQEGTAENVINCFGWSAANAAAVTNVLRESIR